MALARLWPCHPPVSPGGDRLCVSQIIAAREDNLASTIRPFHLLLDQSQPVSCRVLRVIHSYFVTIFYLFSII
jgi:hypothetical protein